MPEVTCFKIQSKRTMSHPARFLYNNEALSSE